jgi:hypothetical protein
MIWLIGITALLVLGWGFTFIRLLFDEWRIRRNCQPGKTIQLQIVPRPASDWVQADPQGV